MKITKICTGDEYQALFINGKLEFAGDYYHDKINEFIDGFFQGLDFCGQKYNWETRFFEHNDGFDGLIQSPDVTLRQYVAQLKKEGFVEI